MKSLMKFYITFVFLDINECIEGLTTCDVNGTCTASTVQCHVDATCSNTPGSYMCVCNNGYDGNGILCVGE